MRAWFYGFIFRKLVVITYLISVFKYIFYVKYLKNDSFSDVRALIHV